MNKYHKIQSIFKRDVETNYKTFLFGEYSIPEFEYLKDNLWIFTEKVDGTNIRVMFNNCEITFNGKTDNAQVHCDLIKRLNETFIPKKEQFTEIFGDGECKVCFYGEGYGAGIQKGGCYRQDKDFVLFDIKIGNCYLQRKDVEDIANKLNIPVVPIIGEGTLNDMIEIVKKGFNSTWGDFIAEGIVARPKTELICRNGNRIITKLKYRDFK